jgi:CAAX prenyl protease-like protein
MNAKRIPDWAPYVAPVALYILFTQFEGSAAPRLYPMLYTAKTAIVGMSLIALRRFFPEASPNARNLAGALLLGLVLFVVWVAAGELAPHIALLGARPAYNPFATLAGLGAFAFLAVRFVGLVGVVPVMEELFWRSFLLRFITHGQEFRNAQPGECRPAAFILVVVCTALTHPEWLAAGLFASALNIQAARTRNLFACIVTHAVTNLCLGVYVLHFHAWKYW